MRNLRPVQRAAGSSRAALASQKQHRQHLLDRKHGFPVANTAAVSRSRRLRLTIEGAERHARRLAAGVEDVEVKGHDLVADWPHL